MLQSSVSVKPVRKDAKRAVADVGPDNGQAAPFPLTKSGWHALASSLHVSKRELQIVRGIFEGGTEATIAEDLDVSIHTVHSHLDRLYKKLHVPNRCAMVVRIFAEYLRLEQHRRRVKETGEPLAREEPEEEHSRPDLGYAI